ncbi:MAG: HDOD domain-containing protein [Planctomycetota bacterium]|jgi:HD-like signal output (HDOD) protein
MSSELIRTGELEELIESTVSIPTIPVTLMEISRICASPDGSAREAGEAIAKDPAIAAKLLRLANSSFYALRNPVSDIYLACSILGLRVIKNLVLQATVLETFSAGHEVRNFDPTELWDHSFKTAVAAQLLVEHGKIDFGISVEEAYTCGLVHDVGKMLLLQSQPVQFADAIELSGSKSIPLAKAEAELFGFSHAHVGGLLAEKWKLSYALQVAVMYHHSPAANPEEWVLGFMVAAANTIAHQVRGGYKSWVGDVIEEESMTCLGLDEETMAVIREAVATTTTGP